MGVEGLSASTVRSAAALTASYVYTSAVQLNGADAVDFDINVSAIGSITSLQMHPQASTDGSNWATYQYETGTSPALADYAPTKAITDVVRFVFTVKPRLLYVRLGIKAAAGSPTGSSCAITATRRVVAK